MIKVVGLRDYRAETPPPNPAVKATSNPGQVGWPTPKNNSGLQSALNEDIAEQRRTGEVARLLKENGFPDSAAKVGSPTLL
jgi:ABC-type amino acid transport substrate-binding protein